MDAFDLRNDEIQEQSVASKPMFSGLNPKLDPPKFNGKQSESEPFKQLLCSIIEDVPDLSAVLKLQYLFRACEVPAKDRIKSLPLVTTNLVVTRDKLVHPYDYPKIRLAKHIDAMVKLSQIKTPNVEQLNALLDKDDEAIQRLKDLDCRTVQYENWFICLVACK